MKILQLAIAAMGGALVGAAAALLLAPQKGVDTRHNIRDYLKKNCNCVNSDEVDKVANKIDEVIECVESGCLMKDDDKT